MKGNFGPIGCGGVIHGHLGRLVLKMTLPLWIQKNHVVEARTIYLDVKTAKDKGLFKIWIESDSLNIINLLKGLFPLSWTIKSIIKDYLEILNDF